MEKTEKMENTKPKRAKSSSKNEKNESVQVVVRCRPLSEKEKMTDDFRIVNAWPSRGVIEIINPKDRARENKKMFTYDAVYDWCATQQNLYDETVRPLVSAVFEGFNGCVFVYGQTGTGKTYTMEGIANDPEKLGMIPRTFEQIWTHINRTNNAQFLVSTNYLEIYMEEIRDLLKTKNTKHLELRETEGQGVHVPNLHTINCKSAEDMLKVMAVGNRNRTVGFTNMNDHSSRSHAIFQISIEMCNTETNVVRIGKLNLIDLAGSERQSKTGAVAERLKEASKINKALSSLGNVISALAEHSPHIPYRDSKLTRLLQDSLGGNSKTIMIANIGPASSNYEETLTTLRYAHRAKEIKNNPIKNEDPKITKLREYQQEIIRLKQLIAERSEKENNKINGLVSSEASVTESDSEDDTSENENKLEHKKELEKTLELEKMKTEELAKKLKSLEKQLVRGGKNILDSMNERQLQIEQQMIEIAARKKREREMQQQLELEEEQTSGLRETFSTLQQELEYKTSKLNKLHNRWLALKQEMKDVKEEFIRDRRDLEATQEDLVKQLRQKCILLDNFIPPDIRVRLFGQVEFDENIDDWILPTKTVAPSELIRCMAKPNNRRPLSDHQIMKAKYSGNNNMRYRIENVCDLSLDKSTSIIESYQPPQIHPKFPAMVDVHFKQECKNNFIDVQEPPPSFQPRMFPRRDLERRYEKASRILMDFNMIDNKHATFNNQHSNKPTVVQKRYINRRL